MAKARFFDGEGELALAELDEWLAGLHGPGYERVYALGMSCKVQFLLWLREQCRRLSIDLDNFDENQDVSHREREILRFVAAGLSNRDIAQAVHLSEATIKWHLHNLFAKLGVRSRTQAVLKGKSLGLLSEA